MRPRLPVMLFLALLGLVAPLLALPATASPAPTAAPAATVTSAASPVARAASLAIRVLSNRRDLVSGGDALVEITLPRGLRPRQVRVTRNGEDVTRRFAVRPDGRFVGLVTGLDVGGNRLRATAGDMIARTRITNHPQGGPVFSGPQLAHYRCQETARDAQCNEPSTYAFFYRSTDPTRPDLQPYDREDPPSDVATTTTDEGVTVPFVVRREYGYQDRDRYTILQLWQPGRRWKPWAPQEQWNRKLLITHGGNCGASYTPGGTPLQDYSGTLESVPGVTPSYVTALGQGFAVASTALANTGHNCSVTMEAESLLMAKERLVEQYGELRYTIGTGCSGGSIAQHTIANAYPGIYQGLVTTCSYPDTLTAGAQFADYHLLRLYFEDPARWAPGVAWSPHEMAAVEGHVSPVNAIVADEALYKAALDPENPCPGTLDPVAGDESTRYDGETNPGGVRCSALDMMLNQLGPRPEAAWSEQEHQAGRGFAGIPFANTGVQFGLAQLRQGVITPAQFVDLNSRLGGLDLNSERTEDRIDGDPAAISRAYRTGLINEATNMDEVAIINHGGPDPGIAHDYAHAFWTEERLRADQGHTDNRVMWFGPAPLIGDPQWANEALLAMDRWLTAVESDRRAVPLADKVAEDRPSDVTDRCVVDAAAAACSVEELQVLQTRLSTPRQEAGGPLANDNVACRLRPFDLADYGPLAAAFTPGQVADLEELFAEGVCDWSAPGRGAGPTETWLRYDDPGGAAAYGGRPLPAVPSRSGGGWFSPSFREIWSR